MTLVSLEAGIEDLIGTKWADRDPREKGRILTIQGFLLGPTEHETYVYGDAYGKNGVRATKIRLDRLGKAWIEVE
jgi:hypothetical protein